MRIFRKPPDLRNIIIDLGLENSAQIINLLKYKANSVRLSSSNEAFI